MGRWGVAFAAGCTVAYAMVHVSGCSLDAEGTAGALDATADAVTADVRIDTTAPDSGADVDVDATPPDAADAADATETSVDCQALGQFFCGTKCVTSCFGCAFGNTQCNSTRVCGPDCSACTGLPFACFNCNGGPTVGVCTGTKCAGITDCACAGGDAGSCPGSTQICTGGGNPACKTCGVGGTDNKQCANGKQCDEQSATCR